MCDVLDKVENRGIVKGESRAELMKELGINWKIENRDVSLFRTLCNFGTRSGCDQEPPQVIA